MRSTMLWIKGCTSFSEAPIGLQLALKYKVVFSGLNGILYTQLSLQEQQSDLQEQHSDHTIPFIQFVREFTKLGLTKSVGGVLALALSRELTPVVTCIILAGMLPPPLPPLLTHGSLAYHSVEKT